jgi:PAS domain S-box-containing protein
LFGNPTCNSINTYISPSVNQILGFSVEEYMPLTLEERIAPESLQIALSLLQEELEKENDPCVSKSRSRLVELEYYKKDGSIIPMESNISFVRDKNGKPVGLRGVSRDITERRQAEELLQESLNRYDELVANVPVGVYVFWMRANGNLEFEYLSNRWCEIHQLKREDVLADVRMVNNQVHPDEQDDFSARNQESFRHRIPFVWEGRFFIGYNKLRWLRIESTPRLFENGDIRWSGVTIDITERRQAIEELNKSNQRLESLLEISQKITSTIDQDEIMQMIVDNIIRLVGRILVPFT